LLTLFERRIIDGCEASNLAPIWVTLTFVIGDEPYGIIVLFPDVCVATSERGHHLKRSETPLDIARIGHHATIRYVNVIRCIVVLFI
jgi:hypothetical protein